jgi:hypothetical protein
MHGNEATTTKALFDFFDMHGGSESEQNSLMHLPFVFQC